MKFFALWLGCLFVYAGGSLMAYPEKPIRVIVPTAAGGGHDGQGQERGQDQDLLHDGTLSLDGCFGQKVGKVGVAELPGPPGSSTPRRANRILGRGSKHSGLNCRSSHPERLFFTEHSHARRRRRMRGMPARPKHSARRA